MKLSQDDHFAMKIHSITYIISHTLQQLVQQRSYSMRNKNILQRGNHYNAHFAALSIC